MRSIALPSLLRLAGAISATILLIVGPTGCGGGSAPPTGSSTELAPEVKQANKSMEDYMKNQPPKPPQ